MIGQFSVLLAAGGPFEAAGRYLNRSGSARENLAFLLFGTVIVSMWVALILWERYRKHLPVVIIQNVSLFEQLCRAHSLNAREIADLREASRYHQLSEPAQLFVEPARLHAIGRDRPQDAARFNQLCERLFGSLINDQPAV
jgi:hypothetical protein